MVGCQVGGLSLDQKYPQTSFVGSDWAYLVHLGKILNRLLLNLFLLGPHLNVVPIVRRAGSLLLCELGEKVNLHVSTRRKGGAGSRE